MQNFDNALAQIEETLTKNSTFVGEGPQFKGVVDGIKENHTHLPMVARKLSKRHRPISSQAGSLLQLARVVSESDDELLEAYLEGKSQPGTGCQSTPRVCKNGKVYPVMATSSLSNIGTQMFLMQ